MDLRKKYFDIHRSVQSIEEELLELKQNSQDQAQRLDFLKYQANEIRNLDLKPGRNRARKSIEKG
ncbi:MAG: hypothetical protein R2827_09800 [Bdellovibrionales bacterium]